MGAELEVRVFSCPESVRRPNPRFIHIPPHGWVQYADHMGSDETIVEAARTSTGKGFISWEPYKRCEKCGFVSDMNVGQCCSSPQPKEYPRGDNGILEYLYKNRHETPAEMPVIRTIWKAPIFVFRQVHRHRAGSYNEQSARYMQLPNDFYAPHPDEVRAQSKTNKQGSEGRLDGIALPFVQSLTEEQTRAYEKYEAAISTGVAPETARMYLPNTIYSVCMIQMNLRMDLHMLGLRDDSHAQGITQQYAQAQAAFTKALFPRWYALYEEYTKYAVRLSRTEAKLVKSWLEQATLTVGHGSEVELELERLLERFK